MDKGVFDQFRSLVYRETGISLGEGKDSLLSSRVLKRLRALNLRDEAEYLKIIESDASGEELKRLVDVISTHTTHFYRESAHFDFLKNEIFSRWQKERPREARVWSAACSSGEEPYSIAMLARRDLDLKQIDFKLLATDVSMEILKKALSGRYGAGQLRELPADLRQSFIRESADGSMQVVPEICRMVLFKQLNLIKFPWPLKGPFDVIFCRNLMIYFDARTRGQLTQNFSRLLRGGGYLFVSHSESLAGVGCGLKKVGSSVYQKFVAE